MVVSLSLKRAMSPVPCWLTERTGEVEVTLKEAAPEYVWEPETVRSPSKVKFPSTERLFWVVIVPVVWRFPFSSITRVEVPKVAPFSKVVCSLKLGVE